MATTNPTPLQPSVDPELPQIANVEIPVEISLTLDIPTQTIIPQGQIKPIYVEVSQDGNLVVPKAGVLNFVGNAFTVTGNGSIANISFVPSGLTGNFGFDGNSLYNINGGIYNNGDLSHGATAFISLPANGNGNPISLLNYYGNITLTSSLNVGNTFTWTFDKSGNIVLPTNTASINYANGDPYISGSNGVIVQDEGSNVVTAGTINFVGSAVTVTDVGGVATITVSSGGGNGSPGGGNTQIQYNYQGDFGADANFTYNQDTQTLGVPNIEFTGTGAVNIESGNDLNLLAAGDVNIKNWSFATSGNIGIAGGAKINPNGVGNVNIDLIAGPGGWAELQSNNANTYVWVEDDNAYIGTNWTGASKQWTFGVNGNLTAPGNISTTGNITGAYILGNIAAPNGNGAVMFNDSGILGADAGFNYDKTANTLFVETGSFAGHPVTGVQGLYVGTAGYVVLGSAVVGQFTSDINSYSQINQQNLNSGSQASTDYIITADNGTDTTHYLDIGLTNSTWDDTETNVLPGLTPNNGYLYVQDGNLTLGTRSGSTSYKWNFDTTGSLSLPTGSKIGPYGMGWTGFTTNGITQGALSLAVLSSNATYQGQTLTSIDLTSGSVDDTQGFISLTAGNVITGVYQWQFAENGHTNPPVLTTTRGDVNNSTITGYTFNIGDGSQEAIITTPDGSESYPNSQRLVINPGKGQDGTSAEGGDIYLWAGRGGNVDGNGGDIKVRGGYGPGNGQGGYIRIEAGDSAGTGTPGYTFIQGGTGANTSGGYVSLQGGYGYNGAGGYINLEGGYGTPDGGYINIQGGAAGGGGQGGNVTIQGGTSSAGLANYGNVFINAGASQWQFLNTGYLSGPSGNLNVSGNISATGNILGNTAGYTIGYRDIPQVSLSANSTAALTDAGKHFYSTTAGNLQITIPDNANVAFPTGATITVVVNAAGNVVVAQGTGVSLYMAGSATTGNRAVGAYGLASVMKVATDTWVISGTGVY